MVAVGVAVDVVAWWLQAQGQASGDDMSKNPSRRTRTHDESQLPPEFHAGYIAMAYQHLDIKGLHWVLQTVFEKSSRVNHNKRATPRMKQLGTGYDSTTKHKLEHDYEQAVYLGSHLKDQERASYFKDAVAPIYKNVLENISPTNTDVGTYVFQEKDKEAGIGQVYNRALHVTNFDSMPIQLINPEIDTAKVERQWFGEEKQYDHPGVVVIDDVMIPQVIHQVHQIMLESTVFYQTRVQSATNKPSFVGAYMSDGLHDRLLMDLALQLSQTFPRVFRGHPLNFMWAYKYDSDYEGITIHTDEAAVNANCWLTPDDANLDPTSGGLVVYTKKPPADWDFRRYNSNAEYVKAHLLKPTGFVNVTVPHR